MKLLRLGDVGERAGEQGWISHHSSHSSWRHRPCACASCAPYQGLEPTLCQSLPGHVLAASQPASAQTFPPMHLAFWVSTDRHSTSGTAAVTQQMFSQAMRDTLDMHLAAQQSTEVWGSWGGPFAPTCAGAWASGRKYVNSSRRSLWDRNSMATWQHGKKHSEHNSTHMRELRTAHPYSFSLSDARDLHVRHAYLLIYIPDGLLALAVHVEDLQESLVDPLIAGKTGLRWQITSAQGQQARNKG